MVSSTSSEDSQGESLTEKLKALSEGDEIEVNCIDETLTVLSTNPVTIFEVRVEASDGSKYDIRETLLEDDILEIEPRKIFSEPRIVRELEVVQK
jgi:hypothetical protein